VCLVWDCAALLVLAVFACLFFIAGSQQLESSEATLKVFPSSMVPFASLNGRLIDC
jgi:hypothetical protein